MVSIARSRSAGADTAADLGIAVGAGTDAAIAAATETTTKPWFRPPYGDEDASVRADVARAGWAGGYGQQVRINHASGIATSYSAGYSVGRQRFRRYLFDLGFYYTGKPGLTAGARPGTAWYRLVPGGARHSHAGDQPVL